MSAAGGVAVPYAVVQVAPDGARALADASGRFSVRLRAGRHTLSAAWPFLDGGPLSRTVHVRAGARAHVDLPLPPTFLPEGIAASNTERDLGYLNGERSRWGMPDGVRANADWSAACAAHDRFLAAQGLLSHVEAPAAPG